MCLGIAACGLFARVIDESFRVYLQLPELDLNLASLAITLFWIVTRGHSNLLAENDRMVVLSLTA